MSDAELIAMIKDRRLSGAERWRRADYAFRQDGRLRKGFVRLGDLDAMTAEDWRRVGPLVKPDL